MLTKTEMLLVAARAETYRAAWEYDWVEAACPVPAVERARLDRVTTLSRQTCLRYG